MQIYKISLIVINVCFITHQIDGATLAKRQIDNFSLFGEDNDVILQKIDAALLEINNNYMQSLFNGTFDKDRQQKFVTLINDMNQLLDTLYAQDRLTEYMIYENRLAQKLMVFNLLRGHLDLNFNEAEINEVIEI